MDTTTSPTSTSSSSTSTSSSNLPPALAPLRNPKYRHISKSAAKRESVQMLGSIKDLQLHFSRAGLVEHRPGAGVGFKGSGLSNLGEEDDEENKPPLTLSDQNKNKRKPYKEVELPRIDFENARRESKNIINDIRGIWGLSLPQPISPDTISANNSNGLPSSKSLYFPINLDTFEGNDVEVSGDIRTSEDIQNALVQTAQSIRRIRFLSLSISHHHNSNGIRKVSNPNRLGGAGKLRSSLSTPSRPSGGVGSGPLRTISGTSVNINTPERKLSYSKSDEIGQSEDILGELRKSALEVLTALRELEERLRIQHNDDEEDRSDTPTPDQRPFSPYENNDEITGEPENYDSEEDELFNPNNIANENTKQDMTNWEDRIISEKREYKDLNDIEWEKMARNSRDSIGKWVGVVENLFMFSREDGDSEGGGGGGMVEDWAKGDWVGSEFERLHSFLLSNLPLDLSLRLPSTKSDNFESTLLSRLSDGYILIHGYNSSLLRSSKPWGFIPDGDVHDTLTSLSSSGQISPKKNQIGEEGGKEKEWTFRKVGNLTCFGAALKHRYQLPISIPTTNLPVPPIPAKLTSRPRPSINTSTTSSKGGDKGIEEKIEFDPMIIAKKSQGWEKMLSEVVGKWVKEVGNEIRGSRGGGGGGIGDGGGSGSGGLVERGGMI